MATIDFRMDWLHCAGDSVPARMLTARLAYGVWYYACLTSATSLDNDAFASPNSIEVFSL